MQLSSIARPSNPFPLNPLRLQPGCADMSETRDGHFAQDILEKHADTDVGDNRASMYLENQDVQIYS